MAAPAEGHSQDQYESKVLAIPSESIGTCVESNRVTNVPDLGKGTRTSTLVISGVDPNRRREIVVLTDARGKLIRLAQTSFVSTGLLAGVGETVLAMFDDSGHARGYRSKMSLQMSDSALARLDTAALRGMRERAVKQTSRKGLDSASARKVELLAAWVRDRCALRSNTR